MKKLFEKFFKKPAQAGADSLSANPYFNARRAWNEQTGRLITERQVWQLVGLFTLTIALASIAGLIYLGSQIKFIPYIVEVDKLGNALAVAPALQTTSVDARIIKAVAGNFIVNSRVITPDARLQLDFMKRVYAVLAINSAAKQKMDDFYRSDAPLSRAEREMVSTEIESVIQRAPKSWQVDWLETTRDRNGVIQKEKEMRALLTFEFNSPTEALSEAQLHENPLGIYITDFNWSKQGY